MKKSVSLLLAACISFNSAKSQITKGNWMIGGSASFRSSKYEATTGYDKQILLQLSGDVGYFVIDKFAIGLIPGYDRTETTGFAHNTVSSYNLGPFIRYYFFPTNRYVNIFSELSYQYGITKNSQNPSTSNSNKLSGLAGCALFFNSSVALEFTLGYSAYSYNNSGKVKSVVAGIGFQFHLEKA